jgi:hypothetical protein
MMKELDYREPFEVTVGCPTVTFELESGALMLPWSSFSSGFREGDQIRLNYSEWQIEIIGSGLGELWKLLQLQDLRQMNQSSREDHGQNSTCRIQTIVAAKLNATSDTVGE